RQFCSGVQRYSGDYLTAVTYGRTQARQQCRHTYCSCNHYELSMNTKSETATVRIIHDTYADSLVLLTATSQVSDLESVSWAGAVMATPMGRDNLAAEGFTEEYVGDAGSNDLVLAVRASDNETADKALEVGAASITS